MGRKRSKKDLSYKTGVIVLVIALLVYAKMTFLKDFNPSFNGLQNINFKIENPFKKNIEVSERSTVEDYSDTEQEKTAIKEEDVFVNIFYTRMSNDKDTYVAVPRKKPATFKGSDVEYAVRQLLNGTTKYEQNKGVTTEIPSSTKLLSYKETPSKIIINLSDDFEFGGGGDSLYKRMYQLIKTVNHNTRKPVYLYLNGRQADVIGGEGLMLKQPLRNNSLEE